MDIESLYPVVSEAIRRAEVLEDLKAPGARGAHLDVSLIEERIATLLPASDEEGAIARRGAVRAAISAREFGRAKELANRFALDKSASRSLKADLRKLSEEASRLAKGVAEPEGRDAAGVTAQPPKEAEQLRAVIRELNDASRILESLVADLTKR